MLRPCLFIFVFQTKIPGVGFLKIHAPWEVLCREAEFMKLKMPTIKVFVLQLLLFSSNLRSVYSIRMWCTLPCCHVIFRNMKSVLEAALRRRSTCLCRKSLHPCNLKLWIARWKMRNTSPTRSHEKNSICKSVVIPGHAKIMFRSTSELRQLCQLIYSSHSTKSPIQTVIVCHVDVWKH